MSGLTGRTSQLLDGTHEFSELVLARMVLLVDQSGSVLPLRSAKAREFGELWREEISAIFVGLFCNRRGARERINGTCL